MTFNQPRKRLFPLKEGTSIIIFLLALFVAVNFGASSGTILSLFGEGLDGSCNYLNLQIILELRLPRALLAVLAGSGLACAGVLSQGLFRNSLATPCVLGTGAAANFGAMLAFFYLPENFFIAKLYGVGISSFVFCLLLTVALFIFLRVRPDGQLGQVILFGIAISAFFSALSALLLNLNMNRGDLLLSNAMHWLLGSLSGKGFSYFLAFLVPYFLGIFVAFYTSLRLDAFSLGDDISFTLGFKPSKTKILCIIGIALLVGTSIALVGPIPFIGLIVPNFSRIIFGPSSSRLLFFSAINGASLLLFSDLIARTAFTPLELEVGVIIALIGAPLFFLLLYKENAVWTQSS